MQTQLPNEIANRRLLSACMGSMPMASGWLIKAEEAISKDQSEGGFIGQHSRANLNKARYAYRLALSSRATKG